MFGGAIVMLMLIIMLMTDLVAVDDGDTVDCMSASLLILYCLHPPCRSHRRTA
jgi:hypothetical protein